MAKSLFMPLSRLEDLGFMIKPHKDNVYDNIHKRMVRMIKHLPNLFRTVEISRQQTPSLRYFPFCDFVIFLIVDRFVFKRRVGLLKGSRIGSIFLKKKLRLLIKVESLEKIILANYKFRT